MNEEKAEGNIFVRQLFGTISLTVFNLLFRRSVENASARRDAIECKWLVVALFAFDMGSGSSHAPEFNFGSSGEEKHKELIYWEFSLTIQLITAIKFYR